MALAQISTIAAEVDNPLGLELDGRYSIDAVLAQAGAVQTFRATDRWLEREIALALCSVDGAGAGLLRASGKAVARITSPHVVNVFGCGECQNLSFVVFERPASTLAAFAHEVPEFWSDEVRVTKAAQELLIGLAALRRAGVATNDLHLGSIGMDDSGRIQLSPWPLNDASLTFDACSRLADIALVTSFLGVGAPGVYSAERSPAGDS